jgi:hypothetical protein
MGNELAITEFSVTGILPYLSENCWFYGRKKTLCSGMISSVIKKNPLELLISVQINLTLG